MHVFLTSVTKQIFFDHTQRNSIVICWWNN